MLIHLSMQQFITVESLELDFFNGTHLVTGETGAGKSILMQAIEIALGARANASFIRQGAQKAEIHLIVDVKNHPAILNWLCEHQLQNTESLIYFRRQIHIEGRSRAFINGIPTPLEKVKELGKHCAYFQEQFAEQALFSKEEQRHLLDQFCDTLNDAHTLQRLSTDWKALKIKQKQWEKIQTEQTQKLAFLNFQLTELEPLQLTENTWAELESAHRKQAQQDKHQQLLQDALSHFQLDEFHLPNRIQALRKNLEELNKLESHYTNWIPSLNECYSILTDLGEELQKQIESQQNTEEELLKIEKKISEHYQLARKYKLNPEQLFNYTQSIKSQLIEIQNIDLKSEMLESELNQIFQQFVVLSKQVSAQRQTGAKSIQQFVNDKLKTLGLKHAHFEIHFQSQIPSLSDDALPAHGIDQIEFLFKANIEQSPQPLHKTISGGELSRLSLCLHLALSEKSNIPTLLFDEIDTGMSGNISKEIGRLLKQLGKSKQVFCITHQASVAVFADRHLCVSKSTQSDKTTTNIQYLNPNQREKEIARLLSGNTESSKTLAHAKELLEQVH